MSNSRYPMLAAVLEKRITQEVYRGKLPTVRELSAEFNLSKQTVSLALKPLIAKGIIKTDGRRGIQIVAPPKSSGMIGIVATGDMSILEGDRKLMELQENISADGFEPVLISVTKKISSNNICKLLNNAFSGVIFTNSTLSFDVAEHLDNQQTPFISCNRLPVYTHINYVETDWSGALGKLAAWMKSSGYRKAGLFFHGRLEGYNRIITKEWQKIKEKLGLEILACDSIRLDYRTSAAENFRKFLTDLKAGQDYPEILIVWHKLDGDFLPLLTAGPLQVPPSTRIIGYSCAGMTYPENITAFDEGLTYARILTAAYETLKEIMIAPTKQRIHRLIGYDMDFRLLTEKPESFNSISNNTQTTRERTEK